MIQLLFWFNHSIILFKTRKKTFLLTFFFTFPSFLLDQFYPCILLSFLSILPPIYLSLNQSQTFFLHVSSIFPPMLTILPLLPFYFNSILVSSFSFLVSCLQFTSGLTNHRLSSMFPPPFLRCWLSCVVCFIVKVVFE